jgi:predicted enzyme related to lactoylglutathione lyase
MLVPFTCYHVIGRRPPAASVARWCAGAARHTILPAAAPLTGERWYDDVALSCYGHLDEDDTMHSPIQRRVGMIFIPVSDMQRAIRWYSALFGLPLGETSHEDKIYDVPMEGETGLILDAHRPVQNSSQPLCFFWTSDIAATHEHLIALGVEILSAVEDIGSVQTLTFLDPDGNLLMVCQRKEP